MTNAELEGRLRQAAVTYEGVAPHIPDLDRRILARIAVTPREEPGSRRSWQVQLVATAAVLAFAAAVGFLIWAAKLHTERLPVGSPRPQVGVPLLVTSSNQVSPIGLLSAQTGWVVSANSLRLTRDGGMHWQDGSPPGISSSCCSVYFLDSTRGWALGGWMSSGGVRLFKTVDGGNSWNQVGPAGGSGPFSAYVPTLDFVDEQYGWMITQDVTSNGTPIGIISRTVDGGVIWTQDSILPAAVDEWNYGSLAPHAWLRFVDRSTGWYIAQDPADYGGQQLYGTHDGGLTWQRQALPVPPQASGATTRIGLPALVMEQLVLPITLADGRVLLDYSDDGGRTWKFDFEGAPLFARGPATQGQGGMAPTFVGNGVIAVVLGDQIEVNVGNGWSTVRPLGITGAIVDIEFANAQVGWVLTSWSCPPNGCPDYRFVLLKTTDGGRTWHQVSS